MAIKEEMDWAKLLGALLAIIILMVVWICCGGWFIKKLNGNEPPNYKIKGDRHGTYNYTGRNSGVERSDDIHLGHYQHAGLRLSVEN